MTKDNDRRLNQELLDAVRSCDFRAARTAVVAGADVNAKDDGHRTPLHFATDDLNPNIARLLIDSGADVNAKDNRLQTPLHWATLNGHIDTMRLLIERGASIKGRDDAGRMPLDCATELASTMAALLQGPAQQQSGHTDRVSKGRDNPKDTGGRRPMRG